VTDLDRHLVELLAALETTDLDPARVERACASVELGLSALTSETPAIELERIVSLHACIRAKAHWRKLETENALQLAQNARARLSRLTRPSDSSSGLDVTG
jgi:hypothetical protein